MSINIFKILDFLITIGTIYLILYKIGIMPQSDKVDRILRNPITGVLMFICCLLGGGGGGGHNCSGSDEDNDYWDDFWDDDD
jgi:hypothetical protein